MFYLMLMSMQLSFMLFMMLVLVFMLFLFLLMRFSMRLWMHTVTILSELLVQVLELFNMCMLTSLMLLMLVLVFFLLSFRSLFHLFLPSFLLFLGQLFCHFVITAFR